MLMGDVTKLLLIIENAPNPIGKNDLQLAQEYREWYLRMQAEFIPKYQPNYEHVHNWVASTTDKRGYKCSGCDK